RDILLGKSNHLERAKEDRSAPVRVLRYGNHSSKIVARIHHRTDLVSKIPGDRLVTFLQVGQWSLPCNRTHCILSTPDTHNQVGFALQSDRKATLTRPRCRILHEEESLGRPLEASLVSLLPALDYSGDVRLCAILRIDECPHFESALLWTLAELLVKR